MIEAADGFRDEGFRILNRNVELVDLSRIETMQRRAPAENRGIGCALVQLDVIHGSFISGELALYGALRVGFDRRARFRQ
jgi:hypothetical protein